MENYPNANDIVNLEDICSHLKQKYQEFQRKSPVEITKTVKWQVDRIVQDVTGTNIQKTVFKKRDFDADLFNKVETKAEENGDASGEEENLYPKFKQTNSMNNMLPSVQKARDEAAILSELKQQEKDENEPARKRQKIEGLKKMIEDNKASAQMEEMLEKFKVNSSLTFEDVGGMKDTIKQLREMIEWPIKHSTVFEWLGVTPPKGILVSGPPGCGKTLLAMAVAGSNPDVSFYKITGPEIVTGISG